MLAINNKQIKPERYYGGELKAVYSGLRPHNEILWLCDELETEAELFLLQSLMADIADENCTAALTMPYIPYSRNDHMERQVGTDESPKKRANTLKAFTKIINGLGFTAVTVCEPHSDVAPMMLDRCKTRSIVGELMNAVLTDIGSDGLRGGGVAFVFPDAGAEKRYSGMEFFKDRQWFEAQKTRDKITNEFTKFRLVGDVTGFHTAIIIDDLCSAGGTFVLSAQALIEQGIRDVYLAVSHCENNIKNGKILKNDDYIKKVYTSDSILTLSHPKIAVAYKFNREMGGNGND